LLKIFTSILIKVFVYIYIKTKFDFNLERNKIVKFLQKLGLKPNWESGNDISDTCNCHCHITLSLPHDTMIAWHDNFYFFYFKKKIQKIKKKKKKFKK